MAKVETCGCRIIAGDDSLTELGAFLKRCKVGRLILLTDATTRRICLPVLENACPGLLNNAEVIEVPPGEQSKTVAMCLKLWNKLMALGADKNSLLINVGGGMVSDLGGFVASTYKRGIDFINIPTTLLAQVDAAIGGKTGVNLNHIKNQIGVYNNPLSVFVYPRFLATLDRKQLLSGFAEVVKYALISGGSLWKDLKLAGAINFFNTSVVSEQNFMFWNEVITRSIRIKGDIVLQDPDEIGRRKTLNFGHTIGHALEGYSLRKTLRRNKTIHLLHGEAVAAGMVCESYLSLKHCGLAPSELEEITSFILSVFGFCIIKKNDYAELIKLMKHDKKMNAGKHAFTLLERIGKPRIGEHCSDEMICKALDYYNNRKI